MEPQALLDSFNSMPKPQKRRASLFSLGLGRIIGLLSAGALVFMLLFVVVTKAEILGIAGLVMAVLTVLALFHWPERGTAIIIFIIYTNLAVVAYKFHGFPQIVAASVSMLLCVPLAVYWFVRRERFLIDYTWLLMVGFLAALFASLMMSKSVPMGMAWITTYLLEGLALYLIIINVVRKFSTLRLVVWGLLIGGALLGGLTLFQETTKSYNNNFGGLAQRNAENWDGDTDRKSAAVDRVRLANRAGGPIGGPNRYAQILMVLLPLGLFRFFDEKVRYKKTLALGFTLLVLSGALLTYSRSGFITLATLMLIMTVLRYIRLYQVVLAVVLFVGAIAVVSPGYLARMETIGGINALFSKDASVKADGATRGRVTEMLAAFNVFLDYPLVGVGPGQYAKYYSIDYMANPEISFRDIAKSRKAHTLYFELMAETGLLGFFTFMSVVAYVLYRLWRIRAKNLASRVAFANMATAFGLSITMYMISAVFLQLAYQRYFWLLIALAGAAIQIMSKDLDEAGDDDTIETPALAVESE